MSSADIELGLKRSKSPYWWLTGEQQINICATVLCYGFMGVRDTVLMANKKPADIVRGSNVG